VSAHLTIPRARAKEDLVPDVRAFSKNEALERIQTKPAPMTARDYILGVIGMSVVATILSLTVYYVVRYLF